MNDLSQIIKAMEEGDPQAASKLLPLVYDELRRLAALRLAQEKPGQTLDPTGLVHEAYLRLIEDDGKKPWNGRSHFFGAAAEAMRRILVEKARRKRRPKHGGDRTRQPIHEASASYEPDEQILDLNEALNDLAAEDPEVAEVVKLRYFVGMTIEQTSDALDVSVSKVNRLWKYGRAWLYQRLSNRINVDLPESLVREVNPFDLSAPPGAEPGE